MLFSVIIPTRNRPEFLQESAASVLAQKDVALELIIVNDGSLPVLAPVDARVRVLDTGEAGAVPARNLGVAAARGDVIAFLDDDDAWTDTQFLARAQYALTAGADFVFADGKLVYPEGHAAKPFAQDATAASLEKDNTILISTVCYKKSVHDALGMFDAALPFYWDWDWYVRVARAGYVLKRIAADVVNIRIHASNMSGQANAAQRQANLSAFMAKHGLSGIALKSHQDFA